MLPLNYNHFYYFYEVARHGSFTAAARELMVSQSSLSIQIKQFEQDMGGRLFDRRKGGVDLTEAGAAAFQVAERVFPEIDRLQSSLLETERQFKGLISVGTVNSIGIYVLPRYPDGVQVRIPRRQDQDRLQGWSEGVLDLLYAGKVDFAIIPWNRRYT